MHGRFVALIAGALSLAPYVPNAAAQPTPLLSVRARNIPLDGGGGGSSGSTPEPLLVAQSSTAVVFATQNLCGLGASEDRPDDFEELLRMRAHVWKVTYTGVSQSGGHSTFDVDWARYDGGAGVPAVTGKQRITLTEGSTYPLDLVRSPAPSACKVGAVMVEIEAGTLEDPAFADTLLLYDLWVTHQDGAGKKQVKHFVASGKQGAAAQFDFEPMRFDVPTLTTDQYDLDVVSRISGTIKGRLRPDGKVALDLETRRLDRLERRGRPTPRSPRATGRKTLELTPGETVEIELPALSGVVAHAASPQSPGVTGRIGIVPKGNAPPSPPVALKDGAIVVSFREFFDGDRFSMLIRVRKGD